MKKFFARRALRDIVALLLLGFVVFCVHGLFGLHFGFWLDDYNHLELCQKNGYAGLATGNAFDWNRRIVHVWWAKKQAGWAYFRPLLVAMRTWELHHFGLNPVPFHSIYLGLYMASILLFYAVVRSWGGRVGFALVASLLFTMHPSHAMTGAWLACDGPVFVAIWTFLALWLLRISMEANHRRALPLFGIFICYGLAMVSRESGVMLGPVLLIFDWIASRQSSEIRQDTSRKTTIWSWLHALAGKRQWLLYSALAAEGIVFLFIRSHYLQGQLSPTSPYFTPPSFPGFVSWVFHKALSDFLGLTLGTPLYPVVNVGWMQERPLTTLAMLLAALAVIVVFFYPIRKSRLAWAIVAAMAMYSAPTLLIMSAAYNFYLVSAGLAILLVMWAKVLWDLHWRLLATMIIMAILSIDGLLQWKYAWGLYAPCLAERLVVNSVMSTNPAQYPPGTKIFLINIPMVTVESAPAIRLRSGRPDLDFCPLTFTTNFLLPDDPVKVVRENENTLLIQIDGPGWFSGRLGEKIELGWYGTSLRDFHEGPVQIAPVAGNLPFRVEVVKADSIGIKALRFIFAKPLSDPSYRFFLGTKKNCAQPLLFSESGMELSTVPDPPWLISAMNLLQVVQSAMDDETNWFLSWH